GGSNPPLSASFLVPDSSEKVLRALSFPEFAPKSAPKIIVDDCPGLVVGEHLKIGGQKRVWRCAFNRKAYVLKALLLDEERRGRVKREIQVMRVCSSPYLPKFGPIPLREVRVEPGTDILYFLEEYIDGLPLHSVYKPMSPQDVANLGLCISDALAA